MNKTMNKHDCGTKQTSIKEDEPKELFSWWRWAVKLVMILVLLNIPQFLGGKLAKHSLGPSPTGIPSTQNTFSAWTYIQPGYWLTEFGTKVCIPLWDALGSCYFYVSRLAEIFEDFWTSMKELIRAFYVVFASPIAFLSGYTSAMAEYAPTSWLSILVGSIILALLFVSLCIYLCYKYWNNVSKWTFFETQCYTWKLFLYQIILSACWFKFPSCAVGTHTHYGACDIALWVLIIANITEGLRIIRIFQYWNDATNGVDTMKLNKM